MKKEKILQYIEDLKDLESKMNPDDVDLSFIEKTNRLVSNLTIDMRNGERGMNVGIKKLLPNASIPQYSKLGDAGMDLVITSIISEDISQITYGYGISLEIPDDYVGLVFPRSSVKNFTIILSNCVGVIDSGYRGEIMTTFKKTNPENDILYKVGDRGAQIIILPYPKINFVEKEELSETQRGEGGFGSTGI
jgi:dUTP pyrophosphatase